MGTFDIQHSKEKKKENQDLDYQNIDNAKMELLDQVSFDVDEMPASILTEEEKILQHVKRVSCVNLDNNKISGESCSSNIKRRLPCVFVIEEKASSIDILTQLLTGVNTEVVAAQGETHFFWRNVNFTLQNFIDFQNLMPQSCPGDKTLERTAVYFRTPDVPLRMHTWLKEVKPKFLVALGDPLQRAISEFLLDRSAAKNGQKWAQPFSHYFNYTFNNLAVIKNTSNVNPDFQPVSFSRYDVSLENWLRYFPIEQFHFIDSDTIMHRNPADELMKVESFLGLQPQARPNKFYGSYTTGYCLKSYPCKKRHSKFNNYQEISMETQRVLEKYFAPHMQKLYKLSGVKFSWIQKYLDIAG